MKNRVLLVDDEPNVLNALKRTLMDESLDIVTVTCPKKALHVLETQAFKVVVSDERMPEMSGSDFLSLVRKKHPDTIRMMLTGHASLESTLKAVNCGEIYRFFLKPWNDLEIVLALRAAIEKYDLEAYNRRLLNTVRRQTQEMKALEIKFPGISTVEKDSSGRVILPEVSDDEISRLITECNDEFY